MIFHYWEVFVDGRIIILIFIIILYKNLKREIEDLTVNETKNKENRKYVEFRGKIVPAKKLDKKVRRPTAFLALVINFLIIFVLVVLFAVLFF